VTDPYGRILGFLDGVSQLLNGINENKSCSITFTLRKSSTPDVTINDIQIRRKTEIKYLGMTVDSKLTWKQHIVKKRKQVNITVKQLNWLLGRK
jgi:hypothetical protein